MVASPLLAVAALNTGNNALYLLLAMTLGVFVAAGALSRHTLKHLRATVVSPAEVYAGAPVAVQVTVRNGSPLLPAAGVVCRLAGMDGSVLAPVVAARGEARCDLITLFKRRGRTPLPPLQLEVRLPLGFFVKAVRLPQNAEVLVFPRRFPGAAARFSEIAAMPARVRRDRRERGGDIDQLREFRTGDDRRDIHWKQSARQGRLIVVERREPARTSRFLALDRQIARRDDGRLRERFEDLVSEVASAAVARLRREEAVGLVLGSSVIPAGSGWRHARRLLTALALVEAVGPGEDPLPAAAAKGPVYRLVGGP
ncbi:MAG: DUF58 domain-containing protein [Acidobacteriota bacterium]